MRLVDPYGATDVYVVRSRTGVVLYVGMTGNLRARMTNHKSVSSWWASDNMVNVERCQTRKEAAAREAELIDELRPLHNRINWRIWETRIDDVRQMLNRGMTRAEIRAAIGIPNESLHRVMYRIASAEKLKNPSFRF